LTGTTSEAHMREDLEVAAIPLQSEEMDVINQLLFSG
jgi:diketogulonate reductase-like aldo/keto reductase